jgi:predicted RNA binding protein YcfA (HicA-like mRNA interferase family)
MKIREVIRKLKQAGWRLVRTSGDHLVLRNDAGRITIASGRLGHDVRPGTYQALLKQTGVAEEKP